MNLFKLRSPHRQGSSGLIEDWLLDFDMDFIKYWLSIFTILMALLSVILVAVWAEGTSTSDGYLGGLNYTNKLGNYHPILLVTGLIFFPTCALLCNKVSPYSQAFNKYLSLLFHSSSIICLIVDMYYINASSTPSYSNNDINEYKAIYTTLDSWILLIAITIYFYNYIIYIVFIVFKLFGSDMLQLVMSKQHDINVLLNVFISTIAVISGIVNINNNSCTRIMKNGIEDTNPAEHYYDLSTGCRLSNGAGVCSFFTSLFVLYVLIPQSNGNSNDGSVLTYAPEQIAVVAAANADVERGGVRINPPPPPQSDTNLLIR